MYACTWCREAQGSNGASRYIYMLKSPVRYSGIAKGSSDMNPLVPLLQGWLLNPKFDAGCAQNLFALALGALNIQAQGAFQNVCIMTRAALGTFFTRCGCTRCGCWAPLAPKLVARRRASTRAGRSADHQHHQSPYVIIAVVFLILNVVV